MWRWAIRLLAFAWYACLVFAGGWFYEMAFSTWHEGDTDQIMGVVGFVLVVVLALVRSAFSSLIAPAGSIVRSSMPPRIPNQKASGTVRPYNSRLQRTTRAIAHDSNAMAAGLALVAAEPPCR
jgi:hypothetical protein